MTVATPLLVGAFCLLALSLPGCGSDTGTTTPAAPPPAPTPAPTPDPPPAPPPAPTNVRVSAAGPGWIEFQWEAGGGVRAYQVQWSVGDADFTNDEANVFFVVLPTYRLSFEDNSTAFFRVRAAIGSADEPVYGDWTDAVEGSTDGPTPPPTFRRVTTEPGLGRLDFVLAVADLNGDGRDDILAGGRIGDHPGATPEERFMKRQLRVLVGERDGSFRHAPQLVHGAIETRVPIVVADDFNGDDRTDLAVFDKGVYVNAHNSGYGNPPQLFLSSSDGRLRPSDALANAVRREHQLRPPAWTLSGPADLHLKSATSGDIDGDGDTDLWVDSIGGANVSSHFMVNHGDGTFEVDEARAPAALRHNPPEYWYHLEGHLVDLDNDGDLDLALGQNRDLRPTTVNQFSIVLINNGTGHFLARIELPRPAFNEGYTSVRGQTNRDVNGDGFQDLLVVHTRNNDALPNVIPWTGRYVQVLINRDEGTAFRDETPVWMGDQSAETAEIRPDGDLMHNDAKPELHDVDRDGCADLVMSQSAGPARRESPLVYRNDGNGRFQAMSPEPFAGSDPWFAYRVAPADVNRDGVIDFVVPLLDRGPDRHPSEDDFTTFVTLLNTTPVGSLRCY